jgi:1,4-dihydroxy-6-naphthoate synthase
MNLSRPLTLGHSPDPDDAFMFWALASGAIDTEGFTFEQILEDIQSLNERAGREELDITAVSAHAYAYLSDRYILLPCGASMGDGYGPLLVARGTMSPERLRRARIAVPGTLTSAFLALRLYLGDFDYDVVPFDQITQAVLDGRAEAGLLIHEGQITYQREGLEAIVDLGAWWKERTGGLPLPLGFNAARKALGQPALSRLARVLLRSIKAGLERRPEALRYAGKWGRGLDTELTDRFVGMYVNELTLDLGERGRAALRHFLDEAFERGFIPRKVVPEFVGLEGKGD